MAVIMEQEIFVAYGDEFDDAWEANCIGSFDEQKVKDYIVKEQEEDVLHNKRVEQIRDFRFQYEEQNPKPPWFFPKKLPHWQGVKKHQITPEMNAARQEIVDENTNRKAEINRMTDEWMKAFIVALKEFMKTINIPENQFEFYCGWSVERRQSYRIEKMKLI